MELVSDQGIFGVVVEKGMTMPMSEERWNTTGTLGTR